MVRAHPLAGLWNPLVMEHRPDIRRIFITHPIVEHLGLEIADVKPGSVTIECEITPELTSDGTTVMGAIVGVLADYAGGLSAVADLEEGWFGAGVNLTVTTIAPAVGKRLKAVGEALKVSRTLGMSRVEVFALGADGSEPVLVAVAGVTAKMFQLST